MSTPKSEVNGKVLKSGVYHNPKVLRQEFVDCDSHGHAHEFTRIVTKPCQPAYDVCKCGAVVPALMAA